MKIAAMCAAVTIVFAACGDDAPQATSTPQAQRGPGCEDTFPFEEAFLPSALRETDVRSGPSGDATPDPDAVEFHHEARGAAIEIRRGAAYYPAEAPSPIGVASVTGQFGPIDGGFSVNFQTGPTRCDRYEITTSGVSADDVVRYAEGLRPKS